MGKNLGKLKRTIKEKCPECGKQLQIRTRAKKSMSNGVEISLDEDYIGCSNKNCGYERGMESRRRNNIEIEI